MQANHPVPKLAAAAGPPLILIHPPAVSKRFLPTRFLPYGMAVLSSYLKEHQVPVIQHDFLPDYLYDFPEAPDFHHPENTFPETELFSYLEGSSGSSRLAAFADRYIRRLDLDSGIYAFSIISYHQFWGALILAKRLRALQPAANIVFGGPFITIRPPAGITRYGLADYWIKGSGEAPLLALYRRHAHLGSTRLADIPGLVYFAGVELKVNPTSRLAASRERPPDFAGLSLDAYRYDHPVTGPQTLFLPYRFSRGCPSQCSFCTGCLVDRYSLKPVDKIMVELQGLSACYGSSAFMFADAAINGSPRQLAAVCRRLPQELPEIRWYAYARIRGFTPELLQMAARAGCMSLFWGLESAHQPTVDFLGKGFQVAQVREIIDASRAAGIKNYIHFMYNTPHETEADLQALIRLVQHYRGCDDVYFMPMRFLLEPQSRLFEDPGAFGLQDLTRAPGSALDREAYIFSEVNGLEAPAIARRNRKHGEILAAVLAEIDAHRPPWGEYL